MAITPSQWSHVLTIPESYTPSVATSGQTLVITESVIAKLSASDQTTFWSNVQNGGGDVRICENSDGTNQLPVEIVSLDNSAQTCVIWTRKPTYSGTGDFYLFIGKVGETQPPVTDTFGRNAVWVDYYFASHNGFTDSSGNILIAQEGGSATATADIFGGLNATELSSGARLFGTNSSAFARPYTLSSWGRINVLGQTRIIATGLSGSSGDQVNLGTSLAEFNSEALRAEDNGINISISGSPQDNTEGAWRSYSLVLEVEQRQARLNGGQLESDVEIGTVTSQQDTVALGRSADTTPFGLQPLSVCEPRVRKGILALSQDQTEYNNQNDPSSFFGTPTLATTGGGGGAVTVDSATTLPSLTATGNASATLPQPSLSASISLTQLSATGSASATLPNPQLDAAITFNAPTVAGSATATLPQPTLQAAITFPVVTANGDASATLPGFNLSASVNIPTITATGEAQATLPQPVVSASVAMPSLTALGAAAATEPSFTVSGNITLQPPTVTGSASATLPQPSISGNIALPSIQASGFIIGGEIVITVELETNINEPQLSVNITEPTLSTNISE